MTFMAGTKKTVVPGLGTYAHTSVGSTAWTTGVHVWFQPEGSARPAIGYLAFKLVLGESLEPIWIRNIDRYRKEIDIPNLDVIAAGAQPILEGIEANDDVGFFFLVHDSAGQEAERLEREQKDRKYWVNLLGMPREEVDPEMEAGYRARHQRAKAKLAEFDLNSAPRLRLMQAFLKESGAWSKRSAKKKPTFSEIYRDFLRDGVPAQLPAKQAA
jgi:hypothetical protein